MALTTVAQNLLDFCLPINSSTWSSRHTAIHVSVSETLGWQDFCRQDCSRMKNSSLDATDRYWTAVRNRPILKYIKMLLTEMYEMMVKVEMTIKLRDSIFKVSCTT